MKELHIDPKLLGLTVSYTDHNKGRINGKILTLYPVNNEILCHIAVIDPIDRQKDGLISLAFLSELKILN